MTQQWTTVSANITLTNNNLVATRVSGGSYTQAYGATAVTSGKYYWEVVFVGTSASNLHSAGIASQYANFADAQAVGFVSGTLGLFGNGGVWTNNSNIDTWATYASGSVLAFALDLTNNRFWGRVANSIWNGGIHANPATNTSGTSIPAAVLLGGVVPACTSSASGNPLDSWTARFAQPSWQYPAPPGFGPFDPGPVNAINWAGNTAIDVASLARSPAQPADYRETDVIGAPAAGLGLAPADPLLGLAALGTQLSEFNAALQNVLTELQTRSDLLRDSLLTRQ